MNWEHHFKNYKRRSVKFEFGTVGGEHTLAEFNDLVRAHSYNIKQTDQAANRLTQAQIQKDPGAWAVWIADWTALKSRWSHILQLSQALNEQWRVLPDNLAPVEEAYIKAAQAVQQSYPELRTTKGDLVDLVGRLSRLGQSADFSSMPQPRSSSDADFLAFKASDTAAKNIEQALKAVTPSNKALIIAGTSLLGVVVILRKLHLL